MPLGRIEQLFFPAREFCDAESFGVTDAFVEFLKRIVIPESI
jgi:hypothetical protein